MGAEYIANVRIEYNLINQGDTLWGRLSTPDTHCANVYSTQVYLHRKVKRRNRVLCLFYNNGTKKNTSSKGIEYSNF